MNWDRTLPPRPAASKGSTQLRGRAKPMKAIANRNKMIGTQQGMPDATQQTLKGRQS